MLAEACKTANYIEDISLPVLMLPTIFFAFLSAASIVYPNVMWALKHWLSTYGGEPSDFYIFMSRISGLILFVVGALAPLMLMYLP